MDHWVRNKKWWWSLLFWALGSMLTNAYVLYLSVNIAYGIPKKDRLSHHNFQKAIALAWIGGPEEEQVQKKNIFTPHKRKRCATSSIATNLSPLTLDTSLLIESTKLKPKCTRVTDESLQTDKGRLRLRTNASLDHLPDPGKYRARCALHRLVGSETQQQIMYCQTCNVHLCISCYRFFHKIDDVNTLKTLTRQHIQKKNECALY